MTSKCFKIFSTRFQAIRRSHSIALEVTSWGCIRDPPKCGLRCRFEAEWHGRFYLITRCELFSSTKQTLGASIHVGLLGPFSLQRPFGQKPIRCHSAALLRGFIAPHRQSPIPNAAKSLNQTQFAKPPTLTITTKGASPALGYNIRRHECPRSLLPAERQQGTEGCKHKLQN